MVATTYLLDTSTCLTFYSPVSRLKLDGPVSVCFKSDPHFTTTWRNLARLCFPAKHPQQFAVTISSVMNFEIRFFLTRRAQLSVSKIEEFKFQFNWVSSSNMDVPGALNIVRKELRVSRTAQMAFPYIELYAIIFVRGVVLWAVCSGFSHCWHKR